MKRLRITPAMHKGLRMIWRRTVDEITPAVRVAIITGAGERHFCTGASVPGLPTDGEDSAMKQGTMEEVNHLSPLSRTRSGSRLSAASTASSPEAVCTSWSTATAPGLVLFGRCRSSWTSTIRSVGQARRAGEHGSGLALDPGHGDAADAGGGQARSACEQQRGLPARHRPHILEARPGSGHAALFPRRPLALAIRGQLARSDPQLQAGDLVRDWSRAIPERSKAAGKLSAAAPGPSGL